MAAFRGRGGGLHAYNVPILKTFRTKLRKNLTPAEAFLWKFIRNSKLDGRKFRRQFSVGPYILDFYCPSEKLAVELDGEVHFNATAIEYDLERKLFVQHYRIRILRFENQLVFQELEMVLEKIRANFGWTKPATLTTQSADHPAAEAASPLLKPGGEFFS